MQLPAALLQSLEGLPGFQTDAFVASHAHSEPITSLRINPHKASGIDVLRDFGPGCTFTPVPWCTTGYYLSERPSFTQDPLLHAGAYYVQEASSMFVEQALRQTVDLSQNLIVLDLAAAPGGKSTLLQSLISRGSLLISNEVIQSRVAVLKENLIKWGSENVLVTNNDSRDFKQLTGLVDVLMVDAPCSGSGLFRRDPQAIQQWSTSHVALCSKRQQRILTDAWDCLKTNGILIYATCAYSVEEDEQIADWLLQQKKLVPIKLRTEAGWGIEEVQTKAGAYGYRFWPHKVKGEGFFLSVFRKLEEVEPITLRVKKNAVPSNADVKAASKWLRQINDRDFVLQGTNVAVVPVNWFAHIQWLMQHLKVRYAGVELGTVAKGDLLPEHALALSQLLSDSLQVLEVNRSEALQYLRRQELDLSPPFRGWAVVSYRGFNLGWVKVLGNRINNYYPKEYRILHL